MPAVKLHPRILITLLSYALFTHLGLLLWMHQAWVPAGITLLFAQAFFWLGLLRSPETAADVFYPHWRQLKSGSWCLLFPVLSAAILLPVSWLWLLVILILLLLGLSQLLQQRQWAKHHKTAPDEA